MPDKGLPCALYSLGSSYNLDQPGDEVYCIDCFKVIVTRLVLPNYRHLWPQDLGTRLIKCTRCGQAVTYDPSLIVELRWNVKREN